MTPPTFTDILLAKQTVSRYLPRTPLVHYPALDKICGTRVLVKHENQQLTGAFKVRGGINLISIVERTDAHSIRFMGKDIIEVSKFMEFILTYEPGLEP